MQKMHENKHSESIASNTKSPTGGIFNQNSSSRTKLNFDFQLSETAKPVGGLPKGKKLTICNVFLSPWAITS
jgi:hypothetical protein